MQDHVNSIFETMEDDFKLASKAESGGEQTDAYVTQTAALST